ncbi:uncharacterized protein LOC116127129 [Pistacia vera]|uniref:uncharacterized protein LOC116127129 n=1 Tax=Pistacia vera TaxID=55513 RepID=UPI001263C5C1|nr:uncharacterized protein LOC116127129 [Pistacia vera]
MQETTSFMSETRATFRNQGASIRNLEVQEWQIAEKLNKRPQGSLPSNTVTNPREQANAIALWCGTVLEEVEQIGKAESPPKDREDSDEEVNKEIIIEEKPTSPKEEEPKREEGSRKLEEEETMTLTEECSAILQKKLPPKLKDPRSFTIHCVIRDITFDKVLCDLGVSINLLPFSVFKKLGIREVNPTTISLQFVDRSIKHPRGIIEDVLVKVDKFIFLADFFVLDMEEDKEIPLVLGRPFLAAGRALIDV